MRTLMLGVAFGLLCGEASAQAPPTQPFDFKGMALGISIEEMREIRPRDGGVDESRVVCTGDPDVGPLSYFETHVDSDEAAVGIRRCAYYGPPYSLGFQGADVASLRIGSDHAAYRYHFEFFADPATGRPTLQRIVLYTSVDARDEVVNALTGRFGPPTQTTDLPMQNNLGALYRGQGVLWRNASSSITVVSPSGRRNRMRVEYELTELSQVADEAIRNIQRSASDRM